MKSALFITIFAFITLGCAPQEKADDELKDKRHVEITTESIRFISVNHQQGSISFPIDGEIHFYYVEASSEASRIQATSSILADIRKSTTLQVASIEYGLHRKIVNLLIFYGDRVIPENLEPKKNEK